MFTDTSSVSSFSSRDNVSRSNMLRRQREAALRRHQIQEPPKNGTLGSDSSNSISHQMGSMTTFAMADVMAWEETKTKERIEARVKEEEIQREEDAWQRAERAKAAEADRRAELEKNKMEEKAREEAAQKLEEEARRLAEENAEVERQQKERLAVEAVRRTHLERLENELMQERLEKERLVVAARVKAEAERIAEHERLEKERLVVAARANVEAERTAKHARMMEQQSLEHRFSTPQGGDGVDHAFKNGSFQSAAYPSNNGHIIDNNGNIVVQQQEPPPQKNHQTGLMMPEHQAPTMAMCYEETSRHVSPDMAGSNNGYERYLSTFHQPAPVNEGGIRRDPSENETVISELTDGNKSPEYTSLLQAEKNASLPISKNTELKGSKIKRSFSSRSLLFTEVNEADKLAHNQDPTEVTHQSSNAQSESSKMDTHKENVFLNQDHSNSISGKPSSVQQITSVENVNLDDPKATRSFLTKPCPKGEGMIQCCVRRSKGIKNALFPEYRVYLKSHNSKTETFLMTSKKRAGNKTSNYLISMSRNDHDKNSDSILGKLRSNFLGTEYTIYDHGKNPGYGDSYYDEKNDEDIRCELGAILYAASTSLGAKGPRKMKVCINNVDDGGNPSKVWQPNKDGEQMVTCFKKETSDFDKLVCLENKPPSWNDDVGAYVLNFNGRVTHASVKNFQLCEQKGEQGQIMQFGRTGKDEFSLDAQWPMSIFQAFAVALSSFDSKLGCD